LNERYHEAKKFIHNYTITKNEKNCKYRPTNATFNKCTKIKVNFKQLNKINPLCTMQLSYKITIDPKRYVHSDYFNYSRQQ